MENQSANFSNWQRRALAWSGMTGVTAGGVSAAYGYVLMNQPKAMWDRMLELVSQAPPASVWNDPQSLMAVGSAVAFGGAMAAFMAVRDGRAGHRHQPEI